MGIGVLSLIRAIDQTMTSANLRETIKYGKSILFPEREKELISSGRNPRTV